MLPIGKQAAPLDRNQRTEETDNQMTEYYMNRGFFCFVFLIGLLLSKLVISSVLVPFSYRITLDKWLYNKYQQVCEIEICLCLERDKTIISQFLSD